MSNETVIEAFDVIEDPEIVKQLWKLYDGAFRDLNQASPCRQSLSQDNFIEALMNDKITKFVLSEKETGKYVGISIITNHLNLVPWISPCYFEDRYPEYFSKKLIYYFLGTAVEVSYRAQSGGLRLLVHIIDALPVKCIVAYDYTEIAEKGMDRFGRMIAHKFDTSGSILDRQVYWSAEK